MKTHSLTRPFAHCSRRRRARALLSPPLYIQNKSRTSNKVVVRLLMELDLPSRTGAGTKRCRQSPENTIPKSLVETHCAGGRAGALFRRRVHPFSCHWRIYDCERFIISLCQTFFSFFSLLSFSLSWVAPGKIFQSFATDPTYLQTQFRRYIKVASKTKITFLVL